MAGKDEKTGSDGNGPLIALGIIGAAIITTAVWFYYTHWADAGGDLERLGSLGDALGPTAAMLNAIALFAAMLSVRLQGQELRLQRQEMKESREVMERQAEHARATAEAQLALTKATRDLAVAQMESNDVEREDQRMQIAFRILENELDLLRLSLDEVRDLASARDDRIQEHYKALRDRMTACGTDLENMRQEHAKKDAEDDKGD